MSRWDGNQFFPSRAKRPPPSDGIKIKKSGTTWWGQRWVDALERMSEGYSNRLARGRTYARAGRTHDLGIDSGKVTAKVTGSRPKPYDVTLNLVSLSDAVWQQAIRAMAEKAQFAAELLAGHMPERIEEAFQSSGGSLFPVAEADLVTHCSCPDLANPCKHVAATHYVLGESLDRDPFLLFELRGRKKAQVLSALRIARAGDREATPEDHSKDPEDRDLGIPSVMLGRLQAESYDQPPEEMGALELSFGPPSAEAAYLRQLGRPTGWRGEASPADLLAPLVHAAAARARRIALGEAETESNLDATLAPETPRPDAGGAKRRSPKRKLKQKEREKKPANRLGAKGALPGKARAR